MAGKKGSWRGPTRRGLRLAALAGLAACGGDPRTGQYIGDVITATDFEQLAGWGADLDALTSEQTHSGHYATFVGPAREFGLTYQLPLYHASVHTIRAVEVDAWVYLPSARAAAALTVQVFRPPGSAEQAPFSDEQLPLLSQVHKFGQWQPVHHIFVLPPGLPGEAQLRLFLWRATSPEPVYLDDLTVKARE